MDKITIKISPEQLDAILLVLSYLPATRGITPQMKAVFNIFDEVYTKLLKKQVDKRNEPVNKKFSLKLKYHEAFALSEVLSIARLRIVDMFYEKNVCLMIINSIQSQL